MAYEATPYLIDWHVELLHIDTVPMHEASGVFSGREMQIGSEQKQRQESFMKKMDLRKIEDVANDPKNVFGALVADDAATERYSDRYIGFIDFATMVLWCLEECEKMRNENSDNGNEGMDCNAPFFSILEQYPNDTLFHVLLLLSKHRLQVIPVIEQSNSQVMGFITENAVMQLLLQSSGLDWFDGISNKALTEFRFENKEHIVHVYGDQNIAEALHILWKSRIGVIAVRDRENDKLIGSVRSSDVFLLLESENLLHNRKTRVEEFIHMEVNKGASDPLIKQDLGILLRHCFLPRMDSPVTNKKTDTLKQVMENMADTKSSFSFLVDGSWQAIGVITLRDMIIQFAPPCIDSSIQGVAFFESALEQTGCHVKNGTVVCNR
ncbi:hypothetical protein FNV43_RR22818 [Rhamnella rubrinervis]|uniref:CBS domain-containing protein n=1 Tax=Rhamnella rubrinervis TaxID=2594499 RepID=A0A8K0DS78_9ROSA|nr:hypothetical protein FNV43_RR22818 [Rhamnella rubrinervis]